jgi:hypothetical protein
MLAAKSMVIRDGQQRMVPSDEIVVGDVLYLQAGDGASRVAGEFCAGGLGGLLPVPRIPEARDRVRVEGGGRFDALATTALLAGSWTSCKRWHYYVPACLIAAPQAPCPPSLPPQQSAPTFASSPSPPSAASNPP